MPRDRIAAAVAAGFAPKRALAQAARRRRRQSALAERWRLVYLGPGLINCAAPVWRKSWIIRKILRVQKHFRQTLRASFSLHLVVFSPLPIAPLLAAEEKTTIFCENAAGIHAVYES
jgi:hypothetical protein